MSVSEERKLEEEEMGFQREFERRKLSRLSRAVDVCTLQEGEVRRRRKRSRRRYSVSSLERSDWLWKRNAVGDELRRSRQYGWFPVGRSDQNYEEWRQR